MSGCEETPEKLDEPTLPVIATLEITGISNTSAIGGGNVLARGSAPVTARGVCWNVEGSPTISDPNTDNGSGTGHFASTINGLTEGESYFVRAYAVNAEGIAYGGQELFTTVTLPTIRTSPVTDIMRKSALSGGEVVFCGGASVTARGVCWNTRGVPTTDDSKTSDGKNVGLFVSNVKGLSANTLYFLRAYATNSVGTAYGEVISFKTLE